jgi:hypothetical protein
MVVDSNMGYSKANFHIQQAITYAVDLRNPEAPQAVLTIQHTHQLPQPQPCPHWQAYVSPEEDAALSHYRWATDRCYWDYVRTFIPAGSQLLAVETQPVPAAWSSSHLDHGNVRMRMDATGLSLLETFLIVPPGGQRETVFRYRLPATVLQPVAEGWHYRLRIQKQAGREAIPLVVAVQLPPDAAYGAALPAPHSQRGSEVTWQLDLATDQALSLTFAAEHAPALSQQPTGTTPYRSR